MVVDSAKVNIAVQFSAAVSFLAVMAPRRRRNLHCLAIFLLWGVDFRVQNLNSYIILGEFLIQHVLSLLNINREWCGRFII